MQKMIALVREDFGVTAIEYALIASLIFVVIVAGVRALGVSTEALYTIISTAMGNL